VTDTEIVMAAEISVKSAARDRGASAHLSQSRLSGISKVERQAHGLLAISSNGRTFCDSMMIGLSASRRRSGVTLFKDKRVTPERRRLALAQVAEGVTCS